MAENNVINNTEEMLSSAREKGLTGSKINILLGQRNYIQLQLNTLNLSKYYSKAEVNFDYVNQGGSISSHKSYYKKQRKFSTDSQKLGKDICDELDDFETKLISELLDMTKTHLELKIRIIDNILNKLGNEKSNIRSG